MFNRYELLDKNTRDDIALRELVQTLLPVLEVHPATSG